MNFKLLALLWIGSILITLSGCKQQPIDAVYYGDWVNTFTEEYDYETGTATTITEESWPTQGAMPPTIHLLDKSRYFQFSRTTSDQVVGNIAGRWSIRDNNNLTVQSDHFLFYGKIVLLNNKLTIEGQQYPLDKNQIAIREKAIQRKLEYRRALANDLAFISEFLKSIDP